MDPGDLVLRGGRVFDPAAARPIDQVADIRIAHGRIVEIGRGLVGGRIIDVKDLWIVPGLIDLHVHLREPGHEYKEDIATGTRAAPRAGSRRSAACRTPSRSTTTRAVTELIVRRARESAPCASTRSAPSPRASRASSSPRWRHEGRRHRRRLRRRPPGDERRASCAARSSTRRTFDLPVVQHAEDLELDRGRRDARGRGRDAARARGPAARAPRA